MKKFREQVSKDIKSKNTYFSIIAKIFKSPSKRVVFYIRLCHLFKRKKLNILAILLRNRIASKYGVFISLKTKIGDGLSFPHATGIVLGEKVEIGENVTIYQQVTIGGQNIGDTKSENYPVIEDNVILYSGCKILGPVKVGRGSIIGANSVVTKNVEEYSVYAGVPSRKIKDLK